MAAQQPGPARSAASPGPPLTMRIRRTHWVVLDYVVAAVCALIIFGTLFHGAALARLPVTGWHARDWLPPVLAVCLSIPVAIRRREPVLALAVILAACAWVLVLRGEVTRGPVLPLAIVLYAVAAARSRRAALIALAASLALLTVQGVILSLTGRGAGNAVGAGLILIICWMIGYSVRQRRGYAARLQQQAMDNAITTERLRIARELHDVVAHSMTVVAVQAGFGEYVFDRQPGEARAALAAIQTVTSEALADMQRMLGALRQAGGGMAGEAAPGPAGGAAGARAQVPATAPLVPAPSLADLDRLVAGTAGAGVRVEVLRTGPARAIPAGIDLSAFRIVQEALTNVVKHSGADRCLVRIAYGAGQLHLEVTDPGQPPVPAPAAGAWAPAMAGAPARAVAGPGGTGTRAALTPGAGHGIAGMRERVSLCGGEFAAGPLPGRGFRVTARFPLPAGAR
jgi:signal transduction histidine kinase